MKNVPCTFMMLNMKKFQEEKNFSRGNKQTKKKKKQHNTQHTQQEGQAM